MTFNYYRYSSYIGDDSTVNSNSSRIIDLDTSRYYPATPPPPSSGLYEFTSFTFTNAGITGRTGPTRANCLASYNTTTYPWLNNTSYFNVVTQGFQEWTVPASATYRITMIGARGGPATGYSGTGAGAYMQATFLFGQGEIYIFVVGQQGLSSTSGCGYLMGGGGGGSFFGSISLGFLLVAGGGGGGSYTASGGTQNATTNQNGNNGAAGGGVAGGLGGTGGNGGGVYTLGCVVGGGGGGGIVSNGTSASGTTNGGSGYGSGFIGGLGPYNSVHGGFGGGGGASTYMGGGGGGYSGGGGGGLSSCTCTSLGAGGGGGSYINTSYGTLIASSSTYNTSGHGSILVEKL